MVRPCLANPALAATMPCVTPYDCDTTVNAAAATHTSLASPKICKDMLLIGS